MTVRDDCVREQIVQAGGTPLRVAIRPGTGTGPPLLLCNGIGMRLEAWRPFVDALDPAIEVICFDAPGVGGSQLPNLPYRFTTLALLLREMLHNLGYQQADVLGISWGGGLAQQFALLNPRLCRRLILVATATGPQTMVPPNPLPPVKNLILRRWGDLWGGSAKTDPDGLTSALHNARISPLSIGFLYQHTAALGFTTLPLLPLIRQRTLVLTGDDDPIIPVANGRILAAGIPHATLHIYHGGHVELATRPSLLTPLITSFLAAPPHDARRAEQVQTGHHPEHQGPRQAAGGTAAAQAAQAAAEADALAEALQAARAAQHAAETAAAQAAAALRDAREQAAAAQAAAREQAAAAREQAAATEGASALRQEAISLSTQERPPGGIHVPRGRPEPAGAQDPPHRRLADLVAEPAQLAVHPAVSPGRVLPRHPQHQVADVRTGPRPTWPFRVCPPACDQPLMPAQQRARRDQPMSPQHAWQQPGQRRQDCPVGPVRPGPGDLTTEHRDLMTEHHDLRLFGRLAATEQHQPAEYPDHDQVEQAKGHEPRSCRNQPFRPNRRSQHPLRVLKRYRVLCVGVPVTIEPSAPLRRPVS